MALCQMAGGFEGSVSKPTPPSDHITLGRRCAFWSGQPDLSDIWLAFHRFGLISLCRPSIQLGFKVCNLTCTDSLKYLNAHFATTVSVGGLFHIKPSLGCRLLAHRVISLRCGIWSLSGA
jgi:hypothetical protein